MTSSAILKKTFHEPIGQVQFVVFEKFMNTTIYLIQIA